MPDLNVILSPKLIDVDVVLGGEDLRLAFDANKVTPAWFDAQSRGLDEGDILTFSRSLSEVVHSWNLTSDGQPVPPDAETLSKFPMYYLRDILNAVAEQPTRAEGEGSRSTSATPPPSSTDEPPRQDRTQNGPTHSTLQPLSESP